MKLDGGFRCFCWPNMLVAKLYDAKFTVAAQDAVGAEESVVATGEVGV